MNNCSNIVKDTQDRNAGEYAFCEQNYLIPFSDTRPVLKAANGLPIVFRSGVVSFAAGLSLFWQVNSANRFKSGIKPKKK